MSESPKKPTPENASKPPVKVVLYKPSMWEETLALLVALLGGLAYVSAVSKTGNFNDAVNVLVKVMMFAILGYILVVMLREFITKSALESIARLKVAQVKLVVKESCGRELSDAEAVELLNKATLALMPKRRSAKKGKAGEKKEVGGGQG